VMGKLSRLAASPSIRDMADRLEGARRGNDRPTIYDVAAACGVAPSTVSRAFSRPGRVNAETAERIRRVAAEIG